MVKATFFDSNFSNENDSSSSNSFSIESVKQDLRNAINGLFKNFIMTKTHQYNNPSFGNFGIYKARVDTNTGSKTKYIVAFVNDDYLEEGSQRLLNSLKWINFQARETEDVKKEFNGYYLEPQNYQPRENKLLYEKIFVEKERKNMYIYRTENLPLKIEILRSSPEDVLPERGTLIGSIELFSTIITIEN
jgi:hypothetical protein